jgi:lysophospholipase L1-like esterase
MILVKSVSALRVLIGNKLIRFLFYGVFLSNYFLESTGGILTFALATLLVVATILLVKEGIESLAKVLGLHLRLHALAMLAMVAGSVMASFVLIEAALQISTLFRKPEDKSRFANTLTMPVELQWRSAQVEGSWRSYYWQGVLHVHNRDNMRITGDFPPARPGIYRIIALGDSLTYGYGIEEKDTYPRVLETLLNDTFRVEVLNLGVSGAQSEDIYNTLREKLPELKPNLVIYGMCVNDFLPSKVGQYDNNRAYQVPLPLKNHFMQKTLTAKLFEQGYDALLMRLGLRVDFLGDILRDFDGYQERFGRDVAAMNAFVKERGLPSVVAMVLDQFPNTKGKGYQVGLAAERQMRSAGMRVIPAEYIRRNDGRSDWYVSRWERHPNEKANRVFAEEFAKVLRDLPDLQAFRRIPGDEVRSLVDTDREFIVHGRTKAIFNESGLIGMSSAR